jgi:hypothetical protein
MDPASLLSEMQEQQALGARVRLQILHNPFDRGMDKAVPMPGMWSDSYLPTDTILSGLLAFMADHAGGNLNSSPNHLLG